MGSLVTVRGPPGGEEAEVKEGSVYIKIKYKIKLRLVNKPECVLIEKKMDDCYIGYWNTLSKENTVDI